MEQETRPGAIKVFFATTPLRKFICKFFLKDAVLSTKKTIAKVLTDRMVQRGGDLVSVH